MRVKMRLRRFGLLLSSLDAFPAMGEKVEYHPRAEGKSGQSQLSKKERDASGFRCAVDHRPFLCHSEAEGSAVLRTLHGNVFSCGCLCARGHWRTREASEG